MNWLLFAAIFIVFNALYAICIKFAGDGITPLYAFLISNTVVFTASLILFFAFKLSGMEMTATLPSAAWIALGGLCIIIFEICFLYMFYLNAPIATASVITRVGALGIIIIAGYLIFKEEMDITKITGIILAFTSIYLLSREA